MVLFNILAAYTLVFTPLFTLGLGLPAILIISIGLLAVLVITHLYGTSSGIRRTTLTYLESLRILQSMMLDGEHDRAKQFVSDILDLANVKPSSEKEQH